MDHGEFIRKVKKQLSLPLPGREAQLRMASQNRMQRFLKLSPPPFAKRSAILILFYPKNGEAHTVLIQRPDYRGVHGGQISFPGGKKENADPDLFFTALREAHEEIGINISEIEILGNLTDLYIFPSNHLVFPVLGTTASPPSFHPDEREVEEVLEIPVSAFFDKFTLRKSEKLNVRGIQIDAPGFRIDKHFVWGATAMILSELIVMMTDQMAEIRSSNIQKSDFMGD